MKSSLKGMEDIQIDELESISSNFWIPKAIIRVQKPGDRQNQEIL